MKTELGKNVRNITLDIIKLLASFFVIFIHFSFDGKTGIIINAIARLAVPLFFCVSGYFKHNDDKCKIKKNIYNLIILFLVSFFIYFSYNIFWLLLKGDFSVVLNYIKGFFTPISFFEFAVFNVTRVAGHLWFLVALIYCYVIQYIIKKYYIGDKYIFLTSFVLITLYFIIANFLPIFNIKIPVYLTRNFWFMGYPLFCFGYFIRKNEKLILNKVDNKTLLILITIGLVETIISVLKIGIKEIYIGSLLVVFSLFVYALKFKHKKYNNVIINLSKCSTCIYVIHLLIGDIIGKFFVKVLGFLHNDKVLINILPIVICIVSTIIALIFNVVLEKFKMCCLYNEAKDVFDKDKIINNVTNDII